MKLLALDPGGTTGFAVYKLIGGVGRSYFEKEKIGIRDTKENRDELVELLLTTNPDILVCENFRLYPWKSNAQAWSQLIESRIIGMCELYAKMNDISLVMQTTDNRDIGYKWGAITRVPKSNPANHAYDAEAHAAFYIIKNGGVIK